MRRIEALISEDPVNLVVHLARYNFARSLIQSDWIGLDYGCGTGYGAALLSKNCSRIDAYDEDSKVIKRSRANYSSLDNLTFYESIDEIKGCYDFIVSFEVIEHMTQQEAIAYLSRLRSLLKDGGMLFSSTPRALPFSERSLNRQLHHVHEYDYETYKEILMTSFRKVLVFSQNDGIISTQNPLMAWNYVAVCLH